MRNQSNHSSRSKKPADAVIALSRNPNKAIQEMIERIDHLHVIYERENTALKKTKTDDFMALQDIKIAAAEEYRHGIQEMIERKDEMRNTDPALRTKLTRMQEEFTILGAKNIEALERMKRCVGRLGGKIRESAKEEAKKQRAISYGEGGKMRDRHNQVMSAGSISETA